VDLDRDLDYYVNVLGLHMTGREGPTAYLKGWDERHAYSFSLTQAERPGMVRMAFRTVDPEDLDYYEKRLQTSGVKYDVIAEDYRRGRALRFQAPSGHTVELYYEIGLHREPPAHGEPGPVAGRAQGHCPTALRPYAGDGAGPGRGDTVFPGGARVPGQ
jgi:catechol 2,3-dioxygenase